MMIYNFIRNLMMKFIYVFVLSSLTCCFVSEGYAQDSLKANDPIEFYILAGQSNMAGRGRMTSEYLAIKPQNVLMFDAGMNLVQAHHPVHFDKPRSVGVGPGLRFGMEMANAHPGVKIGLIPCAVGGTSISKWTEGAYDAATNTHPLDDALIRIGQASKLGKIKGIIWLQGESDSSPERSSEYGERLRAVIQLLRRAAGNDQLPFIAGELGRFYKEEQNINVVLHRLKATDPFMEVVSSAGLSDGGDKLHFDSASADELGRRFAAAMIN